MSKAWGGVGAWAADAEEAEKEAKESGKFVVAASRQENAFPSLGEGVAAAKAPRKKKQTLSLSEFNSGTFAPPGSRQRAAVEGEKLTLAEMAMLPTGPRERDEEDAGGLGGGFRDYGGRYGDREERGRGDRYGDERGQREDEGPSRADGDSDWGASKKFVSSGPRDRGYGGFDRDDDRRSSDRDLTSKADEVDNWGSTKKFVPSDRRGGFDDGPRRGSDGISRADDDSNWGSSKRFTSTVAPPARGYDLGRREPGGDADRWSRREVREESRPVERAGERPRLNLQKRTLPVDAPPPPSSVSSASASSQDGDGAARSKPVRPLEETTAEKGQDWRKPDYESESKPSSRGSSRPQTPDTETLPFKPKPRVNPFGDAKPREVLLEEKGLDWRKIDIELEHKAVDRPESAEEKQLKEEISALEEQLDKMNLANGSKEGTEETKEGGNVEDLNATLAKKQQELLQLTLSLDDKVRFSQRGDKVGSGVRSSRLEEGREDIRNRAVEQNGRKGW